MPSQPIPSVFRQPRSDLQVAAAKQRPRSLAELSELATSGSNLSSLAVDSNIPITRYLIGSETLTKQVETYLQQGAIDDAFIALVRNCKLLIEILPNQHRGYQTLDVETRAKWKKKGQWNLDQLGNVKVLIVNRFEDWRRENPNAPLDGGQGSVGRMSMTSQTQAQREAARGPVPSTGVMESSRSSSMNTAHRPSAAASIEYVKPNRYNDLGFDALPNSRGGPSSAVRSQGHE
jgi:STAM-binding protein